MFYKNPVKTEKSKQANRQEMMMENSSTAMAPLLLRNLATSIFTYADKSLLLFINKFKPFQILHYFLVSFFLFFLQILTSLFSSIITSIYFLKYPAPAAGNGVPAFRSGGSGDSCIARALSQLLSIMNEIPVSSRKYDVVKSMSEKLIDENLVEDCEALSEVNRKVLSAAFSRTLRQLDLAAMEEDGGGGGDNVEKASFYHGLNRVYKTVRYYGDTWTRFGISKGEFSRSGISAEKLSAELLWLAEKMAACGCVEEAVTLWASASDLAWLALSAGPRLQGSLVKVSVFLLKQANETGGKKCEESMIDEQRKTKVKLLLSWIPFLCRASAGLDVPALSISEKAEMEKVLDEMIQSFSDEEEQEKVLCLWLHHYSCCPSSDWPNLHSCYKRWCTSSRKLLIFSENEKIIKAASS